MRWWTAGWLFGLLLTADSPPLLRVDGVLGPMAGVLTLSRDDVDRMVMSVLGEELGATYRTAKEVDFSFGWADLARFRGAFLLWLPS